MKKRQITGILALILAAAVFAGCNSAGDGNPSTAPPDSPSESSQAPESQAPESEAAESPMQYLSIEDLKADIDGGGAGYVILDVRKKEDYDESHLVGAVSADLDAAKNGDAEAGVANLKVALLDATGTETGTADTKYALVCYAGKSYAQTGTDLLIGMGVNKDNIYTLEGGQTAWMEGGDAYTALME